jgi:putative ABC transport system substrate-binding protein
MKAARRDLVGLLFASLVSLHAAAQQPRIHRIGFIVNSVPVAEIAGRAPWSPDGPPDAGKTVREELRRLGWIEGKNLEILWRSVEGDPTRYPAILAELLRERVEVIVALGPGVEQAMKATREVPIVALTSAGMASIGLVDSLNRHNRNVTGFTFETRRELNQKRLQLLKQAIPTAARVAFMSDSAGGISAQTRDAAQAMGITLTFHRFSSTDIESIVEQTAAHGAQAILVDDGVLVYWHGIQRRINEAAAKRGIPVVHSQPWGADNGALLAYGLDTMEGYRRLPYFIDRILKGAKPADLPFEQVDRFWLVVNLAAARRLNIQLPAELTVAADRLIR